MFTGETAETKEKKEESLWGLSCGMEEESNFAFANDVKEESFLFISFLKSCFPGMVVWWFVSKFLVRWWFWGRRFPSSLSVHFHSSGIILVIDIWTN